MFECETECKKFSKEFYENLEKNHYIRRYVDKFHAA